MEVLLIEPDADARALVQRWLVSRGHTVRVCATLDDGLAAGQRGGFAMLIVAWEKDGRVLEIVEGAEPFAVVVVLTEPRPAHELARAIELGARQFIFKPLDDELLPLRLTLAERLAVDLAEREKSQRELAYNARRFRALVQNALDIVAVVGEGGRVSYISPSVQRVLGYTPEELLGMNIYDVMHRDDVATARQAMEESAAGNTARVDVRFLHKSGEWRYLEAFAQNLKDDPSVDGTVVNARDVTERERLEEELARQAFFDTLTGLPNRALFVDRLKLALAQYARRNDTVCVLFVDLDGFKDINDNFGHEVGDRALVEVARRLERCMREGDTAARIGGDEFTVLLGAIGAERDALRVAERIVEALREPIVIDDQPLQVTVSIGVAFSEPDSDPRELLRRADGAMYRAKELGKDRYVVFDADTERAHDPGAAPGR